MKKIGDEMSSVEKEMFELFIEESTEQIETIEGLLLGLEQEYNEEIISELFRMIHSLKGSSASMGYNKLSEFAHDIETLLDRIKSKNVNFNKDICNILFECLDRVKDIKHNIVKNKDDNVSCDDIQEKLQKIIGKKSSKKEKKETLDDFDVTEYELLIMDDAAKKGENVFIIKAEVNAEAVLKSMKALIAINNIKNIGQIIRVVPENYETIEDDSFGGTFKLIIITSRTQELVEKNIDAAGDISNIIIEKFEGKESETNIIDVKVNEKLQDNTLFRQEKRDYIRVNISKLDKLIGIIGELAIDSGRLLQTKDKLKFKYKGDNDVKDLINVSERIDFIGKELEESVMSVRVYTVENIFNRFQRMIRDLASRGNKEIEFITEGKNTELDRGILEEMVDPLVHLIRNAVDHGIETVEERTQKGKNPQGTISLRAKHIENSIIIEVEDDGRGLDLAAIKNKALEKRLITIENMEHITEQEALNLIFIPGFSTAKVVTDISGRGVGMDVVKTNIQKLNGIIDIESVPDKGCKFTIKLPMTLAIIQALLVKEGNISFAIPLSSIIETMRLKNNEVKKEIKKIKGKEAYLWRDQVIPIIRLKNYFNIESKQEEEKAFLVIVEFYNQKICFIIDRLIGEYQIVIKNLSEYLGKGKILGDVKGVSGASLLGDGSIAYVLDIPDILKLLKEHE